MMVGIDGESYATGRLLAVRRPCLNRLFLSLITFARHYDIHLISMQLAML